MVLVMIDFKKNDVHIDLTKMEKTFSGLQNKKIFLNWFLSALTKSTIINKRRHIAICPICNEKNFLLHEGNKVISKYEYRVPDGEINFIVDSSILHLVSVHSLVPDRSLIAALENLYCKSPEN